MLLAGISSFGCFAWHDVSSYLAVTYVHMCSHASHRVEHMWPPVFKTHTDIASSGSACERRVRFYNEVGLCLPTACGAFHQCLAARVCSVCVYAASCFPFCELFLVVVAPLWHEALLTTPALQSAHDTSVILCLYHSCASALAVCRHCR
jgi:hypothetical protein